MDPERITGALDAAFAWFLRSGIQNREVGAKACGGVHSYQDFHPASPIKARNIFDDVRFPPLTITGRELVGLALAGYVAVAGHPTLGTIYRRSCDSKASSLNLVDYQVMITKLKTVEQAKSFFQKAGFRIAA